MNIRNIILIFLTLSILSCDRRQDIPKELNYSFEYLNKSWSSKEIEIFKRMPENDSILSNYDFGIVLQLRNDLFRPNEKSDLIVKFFRDLGINYNGYMSEIILRTYHRHLNNVELDFDDLVNNIVERHKIAAEKHEKDCNKQKREIAKNTYNKFNISDSIQIKMPVNNGSVFGYYCPKDWDFKSSVDLAIEGIITEKFTRDSIEYFDHINYNFKLKILTLNNDQIKYFYEEIKIGNQIDLSLEDSFIIE